MFQKFVSKAAPLAAVAMLAATVARPAAAQEINGAGATFPAPIYLKWFEAYHKTHPNVTFNYQAVGSGAGISQYTAGTVFFGATDAPLNDADLGKISQPTLHVPTVAGAVVLAYNIPGVGPGLKLTSDLIADIYLGKITTWNDRRIEAVNSGVRLPATPIRVVHRSDGSGTTYIFTSYLSAVSKEWANKVGAGKTANWPAGLGGSGNAGVAGLVRNSAGSIGYVELAYALQAKLSYGPIRNRSGNFVNASIATTTAAANAAASRMSHDVRVSIVNGAGVNTYPICGFTYLLVPKHPKDTARGRALVEFLRWAIGPGQDMAENLIYAPLPKSVVAINEKALSSVRVAGR